MNPFAGVPFNEWHVTLGAGAHLGRLGVVLLITVAALMDWLALAHRHALPTIFWAPN